MIIQLSAHRQALPVASIWFGLLLENEGEQKRVSTIFNIHKKIWACQKFLIPPETESWLGPWCSMLFKEHILED